MSSSASIPADYLPALMNEHIDGEPVLNATLYLGPGDNERSIFVAVPEGMKTLGGPQMPVLLALDTAQLMLGSMEAHAGSRMGRWRLRRAQKALERAFYTVGKRFEQHQKASDPR